MKFSSSVDALQKQNKFFRQLVNTLILFDGVLLGILLMMYDRPPVVVERTSRGLEIMTMVATDKNDADIKQAVTLMMHARFNSNAIATELFLNSKELALRAQEQREFKARTMTQAVVIRNITITNDQALVDLDRVIAVGEIRSALKTQLKITFEETTPNELNPYGLLLSAAEPIEPKKTDSGGGNK
jgi:hypothetical protein